MLGFLINPYVLLTTVIGYVIYHVITNYDRFKHWERHGLKGPNPWLGLFRTLWFLLSPKPYLLEFEAIKRYGKVYGVSEPDRNSIVVADADLLKDVLASHFSHFMDRRGGLAVKYVNKFLTQLSGSEWKHTRSIVSPTFTSGKMKAMIHLMQECLEPMMTRIRRSNGRDMDMKSLFGCFTMDVIAKCGFAVDTCTHDDDQHPFVVNAKKFFTFPLWKFFVVIFTPKFLRDKLGLHVMDQSALDYMSSLGQHMIQERRKKGIKAGNRAYNDFLQLMLEAGKDDGQEGEANGKENPEKKGLTDEEIISNILLILLAGIYH